MKNKKIRMSCDEARELMFGYIEGELGRDEASRLAAHLMECPECREELESCRKMLDTLEKIEYRAPEGLHSSVMALVGATPQEKPSPFKKFFGGTGRAVASVGTIAAACAVITLVIVGRGYLLKPSDLAGASEKLMNSSDAGNISSSETIGAQLFASPKTSAETTFDGYVGIDAAGVTASDRMSMTAGEIEAAANGVDAQKKLSSTDTTALYGELPAEISASRVELGVVIEQFLEGRNAVVILPVDTTIGADYGSEVTVAGLESIAFREVDEDAENSLGEIVKLAGIDGVESQVLVPEDGYDSLIIVYESGIQIQIPVPGADN